MLNKALTRSVIVLLFTGLLSACGFHLRESAALPESLQATALTGVSEYSELDLAFKHYFYRAGYSLVDKESAQTILNVSKEKFTRRVLSVNSIGDPNEYELNYQLTVSLVDNNAREMMPPQKVTMYRSYGFNPDVRLAKEAEETHLRKMMINDAVREIMHRVSVVIKNETTR